MHAQRRRNLSPLCTLFIWLSVSPWSAASLETPGRPIAVVHVGPRKTGTTAIQSSTKIYRDQFREDSYLIVDEDPFAGLMKFGTGKPTKTISKCTSIVGNNTESHGCDYPYYRKIEAALQDPKNKIRSYNLVFSQEGMDGNQVNGSKVKALLAAWDVRIVVVYRRFFDWASSLYSHRHRVDIFDHGRVWPERNESVDNIKHWWTREYMEELYEEHAYTTAVVKRYERVFDDVSVLNLHGDTDLVESFFCDQVPNATTACHALRDHEEEAEANPNRRASTAYDELAVSAFLRGLVSGKDISRPELRDMIEKRQEETLGLTNDDFPKDCMSQDVLDRLLELSLLAEETLFPSFFASPRGKDELRQQFEMAATSKLCAVDTDTVLRDEGWIAFFRNVDYSNPNATSIAGPVEKMGGSETLSGTSKDNATRSNDTAPAPSLNVPEEGSGNPNATSIAASKKKLRGANETSSSTAKDSFTSSNDTAPEPSSNVRESSAPRLTLVRHSISGFILIIFILAAIVATRRNRDFDWVGFAPIPTSE